MRFFVAILLLPALAYAVINGSAVTVTGQTLCNNGTIEKYFAGTLTTTCGAGWSVGALGSTLLFEEDFDSRADWENDGKITVPSIPDGWDAVKVDEDWYPTTEPGTQPCLQINGDNPDQVYGGTGKAVIFYKESLEHPDNNNFGSDCFLTADITPSNEVYVEFQLKFQTGFAVTDPEAGGIMKIFRVNSWDGVGGRNDFFTDGNSGPIYLFDWGKSTDFGARHFHAFRCDDQATNYYCSTPNIPVQPRPISSGDMSSNFTGHIAYLSPQLPDLVNGGYLPSTNEPTVSHEQVYGDIWNKFQYYVKLNSAAGVQDGILKVWMNNQPIVSMTTIPWIGTNGDINAKWNTFSIGGNSAFLFDLTNPDLSLRERWYAIDEVKVYSALPAELQE